MALKAVLSKAEFEALTGDLKKEYILKDGIYLLDVTPTELEDGRQFSLDDVKGLKSALGKERQTARDLKKIVDAFEGTDPAEFKKALAELETYRSGSTDEKVKAKIDAAVKQVTDKYNKEVADKDKENKTLSSQLEEMLVTNEATKALTELGAGTAAQLLLPHVKSKVKVAKQDGKFVVQVIGADGAPRISTASGNTGPMTIAELVAEMKTQPTYAVAFPGSGSAGSGGIQNGKGGTAPYVLTQADAKDPAKYRAAKAEAEKAKVELVIQG